MLHMSIHVFIMFYHRFRMRRHVFVRIMNVNTKNKETHTQLQADLIEHLWQNYPDLYNNISVD